MEGYLLHDELLHHHGTLVFSTFKDFSIASTTFSFKKSNGKDIALNTRCFSLSLSTITIAMLGPSLLRQQLGQIPFLSQRLFCSQCSFNLITYHYRNSWSAFSQVSATDAFCFKFWLNHDIQSVLSILRNMDPYLRLFCSP